MTKYKVITEHRTIGEENCSHLPLSQGYVGTFGTITQAKEAITNCNFGNQLKYWMPHHLVDGEKIIFIIQKIDDETNDKGVAIYLECKQAVWKDDEKGNPTISVNTILKVDL